MPIGLIAALPMLAAAVWLTLREMKREETNWICSALCLPLAVPDGGRFFASRFDQKKRFQKNCFRLTSHKVPINKRNHENLQNTAESKRKTGFCIQMQKKERKSLKKGLPNGRQYGIILERQAPSERMTSGSPAGSLWKEPIDAENTGWYRDVPSDPSSEKFKSFEKRAWQKTTSVVK